MFTINTRIFNDENRNNTIKVGTFLFTLFTGFIFVITVFSKDIVRLLNTSYKDSLWIMVIILFSYLLSGYKLIFIILFINEKFLKYKSGIWIFAAILNIALNFWLIPKYSMYGAAIATLISYIVTLIPVLILSNRAIKINYPIKRVNDCKINEIIRRQDITSRTKIELCQQILDSSTEDLYGVFYEEFTFGLKSLIESMTNVTSRNKNSKNIILRANELQKGDLLKLPYNLKIKKKDIKVLDLIELFKNYEWLMIKGLSKTDF